jgi:hypothetical protein
MKEHNIVDILAKEALKRCFNVYGLEGTLEKIYELCSKYPLLLEVHLRNYYELLGIKHEI